MTFSRSLRLLSLAELITVEEDELAARFRFFYYRFSDSLDEEEEEEEELLLLEDDEPLELFARRDLLEFLLFLLTSGHNLRQIVFFIASFRATCTTD